MKVLQYRIEENGLTKMPKGEILLVGCSHGPCVWVLADENAPLVDRDIRSFATGEEVVPNGWYRGSYKTVEVGYAPVTYFVYEWMVNP